MGRVLAGLFAAALALALPSVARAAVALDGIPLRAGIGSLISLDGAPAAVESVDAGHRCTWLRNGGTTTVYFDDDAIVRAIDVQPGATSALAFTLIVEGRATPLAFHAFTAAQADAALAPIAEFSTPGERTYRPAPGQELVLFFDPARGGLVRAVFGERAQVSRLGIVPGDTGGQALEYRAPVARRLTAIPELPGARAALARLSVDRSGAVESVAIVVSSGDPRLDAKIAALVKLDNYRAATVGGRPIAATVFREIR